jgi:catechol 2,3-dioxygenase-like lactoylglutathione lyase family enzyme
VSRFYKTSRCFRAKVLCAEFTWKTVAWTRNGPNEKEKEQMMKFINVRLLVGDMTAAIRFWRDVMGLRITYGEEAMGYAYFETDSAGIELLTRQGFATALGEAMSTPTPESRPAVLVFRVNNVDTAYADFVERGATAVAGPQDRPAWQVRSAHLSDPDGYLIEIYSSLPEANAPTA